jgi:uncharacterized coiled-coil DUF342 family protein
MKINNNNEKIEELKAQVNNICTNLETLNKEKDSLIKIINDLKKADTELIHITDHAIIRFLERIEGIDIEKIKKQIVDEAIIQQYKTLGYGKYLNKSGKCMTVVKHDTALTVVKPDNTCKGY